MSRQFGVQWFLWGCVVALAAVSRVQADPLNSVAKALAKGTKALESRRIAVLLFPYEDGNLSSGSSIVSERLTTLLAQRKGVQIIERSLLANVLGEMKLEESGVTESSGAAKLGGVQNVDAVVTGTLADQGDDVTVVNARLIQLPTGTILAARSAEIERTWPDPPQPPPVPDSDSEDEEQYVMHASPLIYTPWARGGGRRVVEEPGAVAAAGAPQGLPSVGQVAAYQSPVVPPPPVTVVTTGGGNPTVSRWRQANAAQGARAQWLYAMGLTLDAQGHSRQAVRFYRRVLGEASAPSSWQAQARRRLAPAKKTSQN
jgi:TolB-like protein